MLTAKQTKKLLKVKHVKRRVPIYQNVFSKNKRKPNKRAF